MNRGRCLLRVAATPTGPGIGHLICWPRPKLFRLKISSATVRCSSRTSNLSLSNTPLLLFSSVLFSILFDSLCGSRLSFFFSPFPASLRRFPLPFFFPPSLPLEAIRSGRNQHDFPNLSSVDRPALWCPSMAHFRQGLFRRHGILASRLPLQGRRDADVDGDGLIFPDCCLLRDRSRWTRGDALATCVETQRTLPDPQCLLDGC
jgi:hypothetical protein